MTVVLILLLVLVVAVAAWLLGARTQRIRALEAEAERTHAEREDLRARLAERRAELDDLNALLGGADDWIWACDAQGVLTFSAGAALLGDQPLIGRPLSELTHAGDRPFGWNGVLRRRHADGTWRTLDSRSGARRGGGWQGIDRDVGAEPAPVAVVRRPVVDGRRDVVAYEVAGDLPPADLLELGGGRPVWIATAEAPDVDPARVVLQLAADTAPEHAAALRRAGFTLALDGLGPALEHCAYVKVAVAGRRDDELSALIAGPAERGLELVATGVADADELKRCQVLGFALFLGEFFARPSGRGGAGASLRALAELTASDASFEELERIIGADVGLSIALLRHVNSAFFALPREIETVREALTLLGPRAVRRWATVVALSGVAEAPDQLVALALLRGRMAELLGAGASEDEQERLFTVGLFSVADALLDASMEQVLETLPFSDEIAAALLRREGPLGEVLATVLRYEQGHIPADADSTELAEAYLAALKWADSAGRWVA
ncbi:MAG TPA: HDOD domain-containing protein [Solirubrobacter sp.]|nr:HDOD domain-containing protein [Solirubrobacter sp.]